MLPKNKIKLINSLSLKKYRDKSGLFVAEGIKLVNDLLPYFKCEILIRVDESSIHAKQSEIKETIEISETEYKKISNQEHPQGIMAVFEKPVYDWDFATVNKSLSLALDDIQDPGNLGTIIRIADWFGIRHVFCSKNTADVFSPKAVQASMGALARVQIHSVDLSALFSNPDLKVDVFGTFMNGENIYNTEINENGIIVLGNEGNGISEDLEKIIHKKILIPNYPEGVKSSESLNVSIAAAIVCAEFRRRLQK